LPTGLVTLDASADASFAFNYLDYIPFESGVTYKFTTYLMISNQQNCRLEIGATYGLIFSVGFGPNPNTVPIPANTWIPLETTFMALPSSSVAFYFYCYQGAKMDFHMAEVYIRPV